MRCTRVYIPPAPKKTRRIRRTLRERQEANKVKRLNKRLSQLFGISWKKLGAAQEIGDEFRGTAKPTGAIE